MSIELTLLAWTCALALVQIMLAAVFRTREYGAKWNAGPRDETMPPVGQLTGRLERAQRNLFETLPLFAALVLTAHVANREGATTTLGAMLYFWGRVVYLPLYMLGVAYVRTLVWIVSLVGLLMILFACLR